MPFLTEAEPPRGAPLDVLPGIRRVVARNPSVMTYHGTNTYLVDRPDGITVIDPGPNDPAHTQDILAAAGAAPITRLLLTHTHPDHFGGLAALQAATSLPVHAYHVSAKPGFTPEIGLVDGQEVDGFTALFTPGHAADHLCFEYVVPADGRKILFSGDHVMSWSSSIVSPPDGDMLAYYRSLERLLARDEIFYAGGHGPLLGEPRILVRELLAHRQYREGTILDALRAEGAGSVVGLAETLYHKTDTYLRVAAQRNVLAHLLKLQAEGIVTELEPLDTLPPGAPVITAPPGGVRSESGGEGKAMMRDALRRFGVT